MQLKLIVVFLVISHIDLRVIHKKYRWRPHLLYIVHNPPPQFNPAIETNKLSTLSEVLSSTFKTTWENLGSTLSTYNENNYSHSINDETAYDKIVDKNSNESTRESITSTATADSTTTQSTNTFDVITTTSTETFSTESTLREDVFSSDITNSFEDEKSTTEHIEVSGDFIFSNYLTTTNIVPNVDLTVNMLPDEIKTEPTFTKSESEVENENANEINVDDEASAESYLSSPTFTIKDTTVATTKIKTSTISSINFPSLEDGSASEDKTDLSDDDKDVSITKMTSIKLLDSFRSTTTVSGNNFDFAEGGSGSGFGTKLFDDDDEDTLEIKSTTNNFKPASSAATTNFDFDKDTSGSGHKINLIDENDKTALATKMTTIKWLDTSRSTLTASETDFVFNENNSGSSLDNDDNDTTIKLTEIPILTLSNDSRSTASTTNFEFPKEDLSVFNNDKKYTTTINSAHSSKTLAVEDSDKLELDNSKLDSPTISLSTPIENSTYIPEELTVKAESTNNFTKSNGEDIKTINMTRTTTIELPNGFTSSTEIQQYNSNLNLTSKSTTNTNLQTNTLPEKISILYDAITPTITSTVYPKEIESTKNNSGDKVTATVKSATLSDLFKTFATSSDSSDNKNDKESRPKNAESNKLTTFDTYENNKISSTVSSLFKSQTTLSQPTTLSTTNINNNNKNNLITSLVTRLQKEEQEENGEKYTLISDISENTKTTDTDITTFITTRDLLPDSLTGVTIKQLLPNSTVESELSRSFKNNQTLFSNVKSEEKPFISVDTDSEGSSSGDIERGSDDDYEGTEDSGSGMDLS